MRVEAQRVALMACSIVARVRYSDFHRIVRVRARAHVYIVVVANVEDGFVVLRTVIPVYHVVAVTLLHLSDIEVSMLGARQLSALPDLNKDLSLYLGIIIHLEATRPDAVGHGRSAGAPERDVFPTTCVQLRLYLCNALLVAAPRVHVQRFILAEKYGVWRYVEVKGNVVLRADEAVLFGLRIYRELTVSSLVVALAICHNHVELPCNRTGGIGPGMDLHRYLNGLPCVLAYIYWHAVLYREPTNSSVRYAEVRLLHVVWERDLKHEVEVCVAEGRNYAVPIVLNVVEGDARFEVSALKWHVVLAVYICGYRFAVLHIIVAGWNDGQIS